MKTTFLIILLFIGSCTYRVQPPPPPQMGYDPNVPAGNQTAITEHPEYPFVATPQDSAWEIGLWLGFIIFLMCISPWLGRYICHNWLPFWCWCQKCLTKKKD